MWMAELKAVSFSGATVLRLTRADALRFAVRSAVIERDPAAEPRFDAAWARYESDRARHRWADHAEAPLEGFLRDVVGVSHAPSTAGGASDRLGGLLEWHGDALPTLDYLRESGYRTVLMLDLPVALPSAWAERTKPWFDETVACLELGRRTPDSAPFQDVLRRLRASPAKVLHVGEGLVEDVHAARALQFRTALLERFGRSPPDPAAGEWLLRTHGLGPAAVAPDLKLRTLEDLPRALDAFA